MIMTKTDQALANLAEVVKAFDATRLGLGTSQPGKKQTPQNTNNADSNQKLNQRKSGP